MTKEPAQEIVERTIKINMMDRKGVIIGFGDKESIAMFIKENKAVEIDKQAVQQLNGVKMEINLPVL
ncbi:sugar diacid recognition domain-containing protein [Parageobacillus thermoglucosidasius]|uniref:sugar diacid recognition domain-containing protein n=1 Tax=Parageobacillus thermoglucosidasius TaxID=1426 RepID=UPI000F61AFE5|nr:sugar diacid recognition domain-containing protein [Parageobacillus thermoglucosidasius]